MQDAIVDIERYRTTRASFDADERTQLWMVNRLQIIGEAARHPSHAFRDEYSHVPWRLIIGMRDHLVHGYFHIDPDVVWAAVSERIPQLKEHVLAALAKLPEPDGQR